MTTKSALAFGPIDAEHLSTRAISALSVGKEPFVHSSDKTSFTS